MKTNNMFSTGYAASIDYLDISTDSEFERKWIIAKSKRRPIEDRVVNLSHGDLARANNVSVFPVEGDWFVELPWAETLDEPASPIPEAETKEVAEISTNKIEEQLSLWSNREFSPSSSLLKYWQDGIDYYLPENQRGIMVGVSKIFETSTMRAEFTAQLFSALIDELRFARGDREAKFNFLTAQGEFVPFLEIRLSNLFPIKPRELAGFLDLLGRELDAHFRESPLEASWGRIAIEGANVVVKLSAKASVDYPNATKSVLTVKL